MNFHEVSSHYITDLRQKLKEHAHVPIEVELDILKPMLPLHAWKKSNQTKDDYAVRVARLVWLVWKDIQHIWPDFRLNDYCLLFDLERTDREFYFIDKEVGEIRKYPKTIDLQFDRKLSAKMHDEFHSCIFVQYHSNEPFYQRKFLWHQDWIPEYHLKEPHYEDDFEFFEDNICLGQFSYATALLIREWLVVQCHEYHIHMEKTNLHHKVASLVRTTNEADRFLHYLAPTEVQRLHVELSNSLCCAIFNLNNNQLYLNDALARLITLKTDYTKEWYDNNWYCDYNDGLLRYLMMSIALHATFAMNLNLKSNLQYYQLFIEHLLTDCDNPFRGRIYQLGSVQFLTAVLSDLTEDEPDRWKHSYNGKILHTLHKHALNSPTIKPQTRDNGQMDIFFTESIIQSYHHFNLFAKQLQHKGAKFLILPNESHSIKASSVSYYVPAMKYLLNGHMWTKYIRHLDYSSEYGSVQLQNILLGEICLINHHIFIIPLLQNASVTTNNRLIIQSNQIQLNVLVHQQEDNYRTYFVVDSHRDQNYSNVLARPMESKNTCTLL